MRKLSLPVLALLLVWQMRPAGNFALTIDNIMRGPGLVGYEPTGVRWSHDSNTIYFQWKRYTDKEIAPMDTYAVNRDGSELRKLNDEEIKLLPPMVGDMTRDKRRTVYSNTGDLFLFDNTTGKTTQVTKTVDTESNPHFTRDEKRLSYTHNNNVYVMSLETGMVEQLTDVRTAVSPPAAGTAPVAGRGGRGGGGRGGPAPAEPAIEQKGTESQEYLKKEQRELIQVVRDRVALREEQQKKNEKQVVRKPFTLQARQSMGAMQLTPDEKYVIADVFEAAATAARSTIVPNYVTDSVYTEDIPGRSNVGDTQGIAKLAIINVQTGEVKWVDHGQKKAAPAGGSAPAADREIQLGMPVWSEDGTKAVIPGRAFDNKDRWIFALDPATGKTRVLVDM